MFIGDELRDLSFEASVINFYGAAFMRVWIYQIK
jgi:hypothetical protein